MLAYSFQKKSLDCQAKLTGFLQTDCMIIIAIDLTLVAFIALPIGATILGVTVYFFLKTQASLKETLEVSHQRSLPYQKKEKKIARQSVLATWLERLSKKQQAIPVPTPKFKPSTKQLLSAETIVHELKETIAQQQNVLNTYLDKVEEIEQGGKGQLKQHNHDLQKEINKLHGIIEQKDQELEALEQQASGAEKMITKIDEVYVEFEQLQLKMMQLEKQANRANNLAMELEDTKQSYEQIYNELARKQDKLEEVMNENQRMRMEMNMLEDKLSEANLQRQQLQKKVQFLQDLNADMQSLSDTNKKLQTELRRIGELESMLSMMARERDSLLRKKPDQ